jgi:general secretion pathway protein H
MDRRVSRDGTAGFTLIELMIVVTVLAILTTSITLSASRPRDGSASDLGRFQATYGRLQDQAVLSRQLLGLSVTEDGYQRLRWAGGEWQTLGDRVAWRDEVVLIEPVSRLAPLEFAPSGQVTLMRVRFRAGEVVRLCQSDGWGPVSCVAG